MKTLLRFKWAILLCLGGVGVLGWMFATLIHEVRADPGPVFVAPGDTIVSIAEPGKYVIWRVTQASIDGRLQTFADDLPGGATFTVIKLPERTEVPVTTAAGYSESVGTVHRASVCQFEAATGGNYQVTVGGFTGQRAFCVAPNTFWKFFANMFAGICLGNVLLLAGFVVGIVVLVRVITEKKAARAAA